MAYTRSDLNTLCTDLNTRLDASGSSLRYAYQSRNGYHAVDLYVRGKCRRTLGTGSATDCALAVMEHALGLFTGIDTNLKEG